MQLLRPPRGDELRDRTLNGRIYIWRGLYEGRLVADDIASLTKDLTYFQLPHGVPVLLGNHDELGQGLPGELASALEQALREMNGVGIWRSPRDHGVGANPYATLQAVEPPTRRDWQRSLVRLLRRHLSPDWRSRQRVSTSAPYLLPVLSTTDRRAFLRSTWSPFLPEAQWQGEKVKPLGTAHLYLDVSGSMAHELAALSGLLGSLSKWIRQPFWAFSDQVVPAVIQHGFLKTATSGGTSLSCVLRHVAATRPEAAVIVTDGYIEKVDLALVRSCQKTRLHVLVSAAGDPEAIKRSGLPWTRLTEVPR